MNNLDWSNVEDEKDKRIRELEDTLRKQKELMEILQVLGKNESISKSCFVLRGKSIFKSCFAQSKIEEKNHNFQILFCSQRKMQLAEEEDQPNSLPESDEIPDL